MEDNAGCTQQPAAAMNQSPSMSLDSAPQQASARHQHVAAANSSTPASSSHLSTTFEFSSAPSDDSMPSFDPTIAAFTDLSFAQSSVPSPVIQDRGSFASMSRQPECFRRPGPVGSHDKKRIKVDPETPALDSIDYWIRFDDDVDKMGSFEIDYSKRNDPTGKQGPASAANTMPGLGSGLYSTAMAPFREEDFIDDAVFDDQVLSDDEDLFEVAQAGDRPSDAESRNQPPAASTPPLAPALPPPQPVKGMPDAMSLAWGSRPQPVTRPSQSFDEPPRQMRRDIWGPLPRGQSQALSPEEQRHLLEIALNSGHMPASFIPPNGFGLGFGAGLGARPPAEFERRAVGPLAFTTARTTQQSGGPRPYAQFDDGQEPAAPKELPRRPAAARHGSAKKSSGNVTVEAPKPRSADRIAHNDVERKYRTNLKVKIAELRDAVPALQSPLPGAEIADGGPGQQGGPKVSKGTVLTKATEYIQQLEQRNKAIVLEHQQLARRLQAFETLFNSASRQPDIVPNPSMTLFDPRGFC